MNGQRYIDHFDSMQPPAGGLPGWAPSPQFARGPSRAFALASFWVAFGSFLCGWIPFVFAIAIGGAIAAFVFGIIALRRERRQAARGRGYAIAGIVLSVAALGTSAVGFVLTRTVMREVNAFLEVGPHSVEIDNCETSDGLTTLDGSITNDDTRAHRYTLLVSYRSGDELVESDEIAVPSVNPGQTATFHATAFVGDAEQVECRIDSINGPQPFAPVP